MVWFDAQFGFKDPALCQKATWHLRSLLICLLHDHLDPRLWIHYRGTATVEPLHETALLFETGDTMAVSSTQDSLRTEKVSLIILAVCLVVLVGVLVFRPF
jgi:hypothetical protein